MLNVGCYWFEYYNVFNNLLPVVFSLSVITGVPAVVLAYNRPIYRVIILSDEYRLSLSASILPRSWAFGWVGFVNRISKPRGSDGIYVRPSSIDISVCVSIDIRFRFVAVWSEAESQDCNNTEEMKKCLSPIRVFTDDREFGFSMNREVLDRVCPWVACVSQWQVCCSVAMIQNETSCIMRLQDLTVELRNNLWDFMTSL